MAKMTDTDWIDKCIQYAIDQSEFGVGNFNIIQRRCAAREIRPEKIREYIAYKQLHKQLESIIVGSDLYITKPLNTN